MQVGGGVRACRSGRCARMRVWLLDPCVAQRCCVLAVCAARASCASTQSLEFAEWKWLLVALVLVALCAYVT